MTGGTPGPWTSEVDPDDPQMVRIVSADYGTIAVLHDPLAEECDRLEELHANGDQIAACPALRKACEVCSEWLASILPQLGATSRPEAVLRIRMAEDALRQARGSA